MKHVVIGAGAAGITAAETLRQLQPDAEIILVSTDEYVHSRCMLHKYLSHERDESTLNFVDRDFFVNNRISWLRGKRLSSIDADLHSLLLGDGEKLDYDKLLIATGADSFIPPVGAFRTAANVFGLRNLSDAQEIDMLVQDDSRVVIIGSGLVGLDAAYAFVDRGIPVTIVELADSILPMQLDAAAASIYQRLFEENGCKFILGRKAVDTAVNSEGDVTSVVLDDGTNLECDIVIVAAGVRPSFAFLEGSGVETDRGIKVDSNMRTSNPDIFAAGDVTALSGIWPNAMLQGQVAAYNMCGIDKVYDDTYCMKNTINFFGLVTLSLGKYQAEEGEEIFIRESQNGYQRIVLSGGKVRSVILQGNIDYSGFWQFLIKNQIDISKHKEKLFKLAFADFYSVLNDGSYSYRY